MTSSATGATWQRLVPKALVPCSSARVIKALAVETLSHQLQQFEENSLPPHSYRLRRVPHRVGLSHDSVCAAVGSAWGSGVVCCLGPTRCLGELWGQRAAHGGPSRRTAAAAALEQLPRRRRAEDASPPPDLDEGTSGLLRVTSAPTRNRVALALATQRKGTTDSTGWCGFDGRAHGTHGSPGGRQCAVYPNALRA